MVAERKLLIASTAGLAGVMLLSTGCASVTHGGWDFPFDFSLGSHGGQTPDEAAASFEIAGTRSRKQADRAARQGLRTLQTLVTHENFRDLGFQSANQVQRARLGMPMSRYIVRLDELREYDAGEDPDLLFHRVPRVIYPVRADGKTRSSIELVYGRKGWTVAAFGGANRIRAVTAMRGATAQTEARDPATYFQVAIPSLNLTFIGTKKSGNFFLTPIADSAAYGFLKGTTLSAEDVLLAAAVAADQHTGLPS